MPTCDHNTIPPFRFSFRTFLRYCGPGFLMSIAYIDPGNLEAAISSGAMAGYAQLWVLLVTIVFGWIVQTRTLNLGLITGRPLAQHCRERYGRGMRLFLWANVELAIIGSDVQEVVGTAVALRILSHGSIPLWGGTLLSLVGTMLFLILEQTVGVRVLESSFGVLISIMSVTFGVQYFMRLPPQREVLRGIFIPRIPAGTTQQAVGTVGATIMTHNLFLHSAVVLSRELDRANPQEVIDAVYYNTMESGMALFISFFINLVVVANFAHLDYSVCSSERSNMGLTTGGECLASNYGTWALYVWAVGLLASGQSSTCAGTYAGQFVMQGFMNWKISTHTRALLTRTVAIVPACLVASVLPELYLDTLQEWLNIAQALQLPFALLPMMKMTMSTEVMGRTWINDRRMNVVLWCIIAIVSVANITTVVLFSLDLVRSVTSTHRVVAIVVGFVWFGICYAGMLCMTLLRYKNGIEPESTVLIINEPDEENGILN